MLYSEERNFTFVHVWKTAGESIVDTLRPYCEYPFGSRVTTKLLRESPDAVSDMLGWKAKLVNGQHLHATDIRDIMPDGVFDQTYSFGFVRNPWDWTVSSYHYAKQTKANPEHELVSSFDSLKDYVAHREEVFPRQQSSFLFDEDDRQIVTKIGKFENLQDDFAEICTSLGIDAPLGKRNVSSRKRDWRIYYDDETYDRVAKLYAKDIRLLGYEE